jgi:hypothetical protein
MASPAISVVMSNGCRGVLREIHSYRVKQRLKAMKQMARAISTQAVIFSVIQQSRNAKAAATN